MKNQAVLVLTENAYWGRGETLNEALKAARYRKGTRVNITVYSCKPEELHIDDMGSVGYPPNANPITITNGYEKI